MRLVRRYVEKPWGRTRLPPMFDSPPGKRIGEVWFVGGGEELPLLAKYIFTSERLSIQVHPDDTAARARGLVQGKSECWYILDAEPGATLGLGLTGQIAQERLREAAIDGSIEQLVHWREVRAGDFVFVPAGTIHAIGAGISLLEFQQNSDVTYRLYDYGRPRELHLDDALEVADRAPFPEHLFQRLGARDERTLVDGPHFTLAIGRSDPLTDRRRWLLPIDGPAAGDCVLAEPGEAVDSGGARLLVGAMTEPS
ncbi:MAG: class I mannose-6-phosphate isomerase [Sphingomicrobium sp.]